MPTFLVESYVPRAESEAALTVASLVAAGADARLRWSIVLPVEDICLHVFDGPSAEVVREATVRAALHCQRVSEVVLISAADINSPESSVGGKPTT
ncbi:MAG TPA: hypothetical protein VFU26_09480 [Gaiellaceae bacterium]|nr:hypothetical protein [Gaiellaceae bacterium]